MNRWETKGQSPAQMLIDAVRLEGSIQFDKDQRVSFLPAVQDQTTLQIFCVCVGICDSCLQLEGKQNTLLLLDMALEPAFQVAAENGKTVDLILEMCIRDSRRDRCG